MAENNRISFPFASIQAPDYATEATVLRACARAGVFCIGVAADMVLFQQPSTTLVIAVSEFEDPQRAIEIIRGKLANQVQP
jgi:hypothetical protein